MAHCDDCEKMMQPYLDRALSDAEYLEAEQHHHDGGKRAVDDAHERHVGEVPDEQVAHGFEQQAFPIGDVAEALAGILFEAGRYEAAHLRHVGLQCICHRVGRQGQQRGLHVLRALGSG